jgi:hypothetical protein
MKRNRAHEPSPAAPKAGVVAPPSPYDLRKDIERLESGF